MNTLLITGSAKQVADLSNPQEIGFNVEYDVILWGSNTGEALQFVTSKKITLPNYGHLWKEFKEIGMRYFNNPKFEDGAYTQFLDHITIL
jgi:hypothetical protein